MSKRARQMVFQAQETYKLNDKNSSLEKDVRLQISPIKNDNLNLDTSVTNIENINDFVFLDDYNISKDINIFDASFSNVNFEQHEISLTDLSHITLPEEEHLLQKGEIVLEQFLQKEDTTQQKHLEEGAIPENPLETISEQGSEKVTKSGNDRKRKSYDIPLSDRKKLKLKEKVSKFEVKPPCQCKKKCFQLISQEQMICINKQYWTLNWQSQRVFIVNNVDRTAVARKKEKSTRNNTYTYFLPKSSGAKAQVCKVFFLATLGYLPGNDKMLHNALSCPTETSNIGDCYAMVQIDKRGKYVVNFNKISEL